nr:hypothetical protein [Tanacetum cinerariifolium]
REEESFDPIPRTPEDSEDDGNSEEDKDSHLTLTPINPDGQQESSSVSSQFVTSMLNPTSDAGMESIFATASSTVAPLQTSTPIMTPSTIATITTTSHAPIPSTTISREVLQNLPTFDSVFHFEDRLKSLESNFSEYIQTNLFGEAVSNIPGPSAGSDRGSKRRREGKEPKSASAPLQTATRSAGSNNGVRCEDKLKGAHFRAKMMIFEDCLFLTTYVVSMKEDTAYQRLDFTRKRVRSIPNTAYPSEYIHRILLVKQSKIMH